MSQSSMEVDVVGNSSELAVTGISSETSSQETGRSPDPGFPRSCLLANCYLKKPKVFQNVDEYTKHVMRCMQQDDRRKATADFVLDRSASPRRQSARITSVPLRVRVDHETSTSASTPCRSPSNGGDVTPLPMTLVRTPPVPPATPSAATSPAESKGYADLQDRRRTLGDGGVFSGVGGGRDSDDNDVATNWCVKGPSNGSSSTISDGGDGNNGGSGGGSGDESTLQRMDNAVLSNGPNGCNGMIDAADRNGPGNSSGGRARLQWSQAITAGPGNMDDLVEYTATGRPTRKPGGRSNPGRAGSNGEVPPAGSVAQRPRASSVASAARGRAITASQEYGIRSRASSTPANGVIEETPRGQVFAGEEGAAALERTTITRGRASCDSSSAVNGSGASGDTSESDAGVVLGAAVTGATSSSRGAVSNWKGSLGLWGPGGGFTCPVKPLEEWDLPGCGKYSRARDTKCDSCHRVLRVDWLVGAAASIGSGVENPQLKLAGEVTFENKMGLTYMGKVVAIDPRPKPGAPRGVVRVKYNDWPYDRYDEDISMELVTPKGWLPTALGRAGRRASKPVKTFSPSLDSYFRRRSVSAAEALFMRCQGALDKEKKDDGDESGINYSAGGKEELEEVGAEEGKDKELPRVKVWVCKHVRRGLAEPINRLGQCKICYNADRKAKAGIKMCRHVREGEARAYGRGPGDYGKGHCRECFVRRFPVKKVKVPRPRLWPSCAMPGCRRRHFAWTMCAPCGMSFKEKHPYADIQHQGKRRNGKSMWKYIGKDTEFTDSSEDEETPQDSDDHFPSDQSHPEEVEATSTSPSSTNRKTDRKTRSGIASPSREAALADAASKRGGAASATRQAKRARVRMSEDEPTCFYCQKSEGMDGKDMLLLCSEFDCNRRVHMQCTIPALDEAPERFYCPLCIEQGKAEACEDPCMACKSNDRDNLMLVCDRDKCYRYFHCFCLPLPLECPPKGEYVCPVCTGQDLERGLVISKTSGGVRPARTIAAKVEGNGLLEEVRRCGVCFKRAVCATMWTCGSGKELCKGVTFHKKCLARGKPFGSSHSATLSRNSGQSISLNGMPRVSSGSSSGVDDLAWGSGSDKGLAVEVWDSENNRLCCPECGFDLLMVDEVNNTTEEEAYEGTADQELAYKTFERALQMSLENPRFGIGQTREMFEEPFKGSIGSGAYRTAMYGSVFEAAVDLMFRKSKLTSEHKFLDIGCGIGSIVLQAAAWAGCQAAGVEIVEDRYEGAVTLHNAFKKAVTSESDLMERMHPDVVENKVHLFKGCFLEQWKHPEVRDADFIFFNNSSGWFNNSKALNNPDEHSLEARLLHRLKNDPRNNGKILITLEHIAEWQPDCWERRTYKYSCDTKRAATYAANELEFWEYTVVSQWECPGCTSLNSDAVNDCIVCGTYCRNKRKSKRL